MVDDNKFVNQREQGNGKNKDIPIIINTAYSNYKNSFMSWAADAYIVKSSDLTELKNKIKKILTKKAKGL